MDEAEELFRGLKEPDLPMYNKMIDLCGMHGRLDKAEQVFGNLQAVALKPDIVTLSTMVKVYCRNKKLDAARSLLERTDKDYGVPCCPSLINVYLNELLHGGMLQIVYDVLDNMEELYGVSPQSLPRSTLAKIPPR